jgi:GT2 family glycosyltransferase
MHQVSVIVSNFNGAKWLPRLLETLKAQVGVEVEIIIVDRNSTDESDSILAQHPDVKVHKHPPETGLVCGYDEGVPHASHELLFFCNEDMWFEPECLKRVCDAVDLPKRVGAVMPVQWTYDLKDIVNCGAWFKKSWWCPSNPYPFRYSVWQLKEETSPVSGINAGACLVHRRVYEEIGGWDRTFFLDYEDMDLSIRLWQHGWDCLVVPSAKVGHAVGASNNKALNNGFKVSRKRYIGGTSNVIACAMKCFTGPSMLLPVIALGDRLLRNLVCLRMERAWWDMLSAVDAFKRLPDFLEYRSKNQQWNSQRPGQKFFVDPRFKYEG